MINPFQPYLIKLKLSSFSITKLLPNITTLAALCSGLSAIRLGLNHEFETAIKLVLIAAFLDAMDGRLARFFNSVTRFGAELDSLADFVNFGVVPSLIIYIFSLKTLSHYGWMVTLLFCVCAALRLARFNTMSIEDDPTPHPGTYRFFTGVPMPAAAFLMLSPLMVYIELGQTLPPILYSFWSIIVSFLMVSKIPTFSFKTAKIKHTYILPILVSATIVIGGLITEPWLTMPIIGLVYLISIVFSRRAFRLITQSEQKSQDQV